MKNIKKLKTTNPLRANFLEIGPYSTPDDAPDYSEDSTISTSDSSSSDTPWWSVADSIGNTLISVFQGIVSPLLGGSSNSVMVVEEKHNTTKFVVYGIIAIVLIVILFKYLKK